VKVDGYHPHVINLSNFDDYIKDNRLYHFIEEHFATFDKNESK